MKFPSLTALQRRRHAEPPTVRSIGADVFSEHAQAMMVQTERVLTDIVEGRITIAGGEEGVASAEAVRRRRENLLDRVDRELLVQELEERVRQAAQLEELQVRYPHLVAAAVRTLSQRRERTGRDTQVTVVEPEPSTTEEAQR